MKVAKNSRALIFAKILEFCTDYKDAKDIAKALFTTEMTSRKYMKILIDAGYVSFVAKSQKKKSMRKIKTTVEKLPEIALLDLCEKYRAKFAKYSINLNAIRKAKRIADKVAVEEIKKVANTGSVDKKTGARVFLLADTQHWKSEKKKPGKFYVSGSSLSM